MADADMPPKIVHNSPYYKGPQDRPDDFITPVKLKTYNFDERVYLVYMALIVRHKFCLLDGTTTPSTVDDWLTLYFMLVSWIVYTIDTEVKTLQSNYENTYMLWKDLHKRFSVDNGPRIQQLKLDIARCEQGKSMSIIIYFGKLKVLWDKLNNYEHILSCLCGKCTCSLRKAHEKRRKEKCLHQLLMGLRFDAYRQIRSTLLYQDPLPSLNRVFQHICQEERVCEISLVKG